MLIGRTVFLHGGNTITKIRDVNAFLDNYNHRGGKKRLEIIKRDNAVCQYCHERADYIGTYTHTSNHTSLIAFSVKNMD